MHNAHIVGNVYSGAKVHFLDFVQLLTYKNTPFSPNTHLFLQKYTFFSQVKTQNRKNATASKTPSPIIFQNFPKIPNHTPRQRRIKVTKGTVLLKVTKGTVLLVYSPPHLGTFPSPFTRFPAKSLLIWRFLTKFAMELRIS